MNITLQFVFLFFIIFAFASFAGGKSEKDTVKTSKGDFEIFFLGHGSLLFSFESKSIYVDPFSNVADYSLMPKADLILITHEHADHLDTKALKNIRTDNTILIISKSCTSQVQDGTVMKNGEKKTVIGLLVEAVPAYNLKKEFHPKGVGNGYIITLGDKKVYVAGDTENIPEMKALKDIYIAFLPMNLPFTMTPEMAADAAKIIQPKILYPYHYGNTDTSKLIDIMKNNHSIEVRIRNMQ